MSTKPAKKEYLDKKYHSRDEKGVYVDRVFTLPNVLTLSRLIALPLLLWYVHKIDVHGPIPIFIVGGYMFLSDALDGALAKALGQISLIGAILDPVVDKLIINALAIFFAFKGWIPIWAASVILLRDLALLIFGLRIFVNYGTLVTPVAVGRITPLAWGVVFVTALFGFHTLKWIFIPVAIVLTLTSAFVYYSRYKDLLKQKERSE